MATRQYIGARYVIKIYENSQTAGSAEWEANTSYEPLTMVTYQNSSYLSKKAVPATVGNPASNTTYWVITGAYNGQIASLQSQIDDANLDIKSTPYVDAVLNGIDNTGATDVTSAVQTLMNNNPNRTIFFKAGTYKFTNSITVKASILGEAGTEFTFSGSGNFLCFNSSSASLGIENLSITCSTTGGTNNGIYADDSSLIRLKNLHLYKCSISMSLCRVCYLQNIWSDYAYKGIYLGSCVRIFVDNFEFSHCTTYGIEVTKSNNAQLSDVIEFSNGECNVSGSYGIYCHDMSDGFVRFYFVQTSSSTTQSWYLKNTDQMALINCYAEAGEHTVNYGMYIEGSTNATLYNFHSVGFSSAGIRIVASTRITLDSCQIWSCPTGIETIANNTAGCNNLIIDGCNIYNDVTTGINFYRSGSTYNTDCIITNNIISATTPLNINDSRNTSTRNNYNGSGVKLEYVTANTDQYGSITISLRNLKSLPIVRFTGNDIAFACIQSTTSSSGYYTSVRYQLIKYVIDNGAWVFKTADSQSIEYTLEY